MSQRELPLPPAQGDLPVPHWGDKPKQVWCHKCQAIVTPELKKLCGC